jgi:hypothetical protein
VLVVGSAGDRIAIATLSKQIDPRSVCETLAVWCGVRLTVTMRERELTVPHRVVGLATGDKAPDSRFNGNPVTILGAQLAEVRPDRRDATPGPGISDWH